MGVKMPEFLPNNRDTEVLKYCSETASHSVYDKGKMTQIF